MKDCGQKQQMKAYDQKQQKAIKAGNGYHLVLAPPGCGKTDILSERIVHAKENGINFDDMLCLTFTNRASRGMRERIREKVGMDAQAIFTGNIHRFCSNFLYNYSLIPENTAIMDDDDLTDLMQTYDPAFFTNSHGTTDKLKISVVDDIDAYISQKLLSHPASAFYLPSEFDLYYNIAQRIDFNPDAAPISEKQLKYALMYRKYKQEHNYISFSDILIRAYDALHNDTCHAYKRYKWIQVDEVQDLNSLQISIIDELLDSSSHDFTIMYLGDEQQAIFSFLGAKLGCLNLLKERCKGNILTLNNNYRSPKYLTEVFNTYAETELNVSHELLPEAFHQDERQLYDLILTHNNTTNDEEARIGKMIDFYMKNDNERIAILVPTNAAADRISSKLSEKGVRHFKISGVDFFRTSEYKTLSSFFSVCINSFNHLAWARLLYGIGATRTYAQAREFTDALKRLSMTPFDLFHKQSYVERFNETYMEKEFVFFDTETTGLNVLSDDIVQIAAFKVNHGKIVEGSDFNIFIHTEKDIPTKLGNIDNPLIEAYRNNPHCTKEEGLKRFLDYIGDCPILGHNVNFDYHILQYNVERYLNRHIEFETFDSLHLIKCVEPQLRMYKLAFLLKELHLEGKNSHLADEDIAATKALVDYCFEKSQAVISKQHEFTGQTTVGNIVDKLLPLKPIFEEFKDCLYQSVDENENSMDFQLLKVYKQLHEIDKIKDIGDKFNIFLLFIQSEWQTDNDCTLFDAISQHINDLTCGINEGDLINSEDIVNDRVFIMTIHKGKGLEFDNVIILEANDGTYPFYMTNKILNTPWRYSDKEFCQAEQDRMEDARKFYVALTRAKKRICVSYTYFNSYGIETHITPFMKSIQKYFYGK